jgi:hypothetical protein
MKTSLAKLALLLALFVAASSICIGLGKSPVSIQNESPYRLQHDLLF